MDERVMPFHRGKAVEYMTNVNREMVGKKIRQERLKRNLTQLELAIELGTNAPKICRTERGREPLTRPQYEAIASVLGITFEELMQPPERMVTYISLQHLRKEKSSKR